MNTGDDLRFSPATGFEYGIELASCPLDIDGPHRWGMTATEANRFILEWEQDGGPPVFFVIRRPVGQWERVEDGE